MFWLQQRFPNLAIKGIEPVEALRSQGFRKSISHNDLLPGVYALEAHIAYHFNRGNQRNDSRFGFYSIPTSTHSDGQATTEAR